MTDQDSSMDETDVKLKKEICEDEIVDTTTHFLRIFKGKTKFGSWDEFNTLFEDFQKETGSVFKPKSATTVENANERRSSKGKIPDRFVYQTVKMICQHFGEPVKREGSRRKKYVGCGCEAMVHLQYKNDYLHILSCNLEHKNHKLLARASDNIRNGRSFSFADDIDLLMAKVVLEHNPFSAWSSEKEWASVVDDLQAKDPRLKSTTVRVVKKRIRFLIDRYLANCNGKHPSSDDELGTVLYELAKTKQDAMDSVPLQPAKKRGRGRPRKREKEETDEEDEDQDDSHLDLDDSATLNQAPVTGEKYKAKKTGTTAPSSSFNRDIYAFFSYMENKDEEDRQIRQLDISLRREELELHKREFELQKEKFDFDRVERQTHLELLKAQLEIFAGPKYRPTVTDGKIDANAVTEYTIVVNNDQGFVSQ